MTPYREDKWWITTGVMLAQLVILLIVLIASMAARPPDKQLRPVIFRFQPLEPFQPLYDDERDA